MWKKGIDYPEWMDEAALDTLRKGYLMGNETPKEAMMGIAETVEYYLQGVEREGVITNKIFNYLWRGWLCPSTPMWSNLRHKRGASISCFSSYVSDNIPSIGFTLSEVMRMTQLGGGTSVYWGDVRPRGSAISSGGKTNGSLSFIEIFDTMINKVSQCSSRRGACAMYLPIDHGDIEEFLTIKDNDSPIKNLFYGVCIPDSFMNKLYEGDKYSWDIWAKLLKSRSEKGLPYIFFTDNANNHISTPEWYGYKQTNPDYFIRSSNLCVAPNTLILTDSGYIPIGDLENKQVTIWNGLEWSDITVFKTGINKQLFRVTTNCGYSVDCTPEHKFYVMPEERSNRKPVEVEAQHLNIGDKLYKCQLPIIEGDLVLEYAYDNGFYSGDGCFFRSTQIIYLYNDKRALVPHLPVIDKWYNNEPQQRLIGRTKKLRDKFFVPDATFTIESRLSWLSGYLDADGTVTNNNGSQSLQAGSTEKNFLKDIQLMLQTLGVDSKVAHAIVAGSRLLPKNDGSGELGYYNCREAYRLLINGNSLYKLTQLGLKCNRLKWLTTKPARECSQFIKIKSVDALPDLSDTFCFTEPKRHMGMFNGLLLSNCNEIQLPVNPDESFVCCVYSLNLAKYDEWVDTDLIKYAIYLGNAVLDDFIYKTKGDKLMKRAHKFTVNHRALGLGVLGWHTYLQSKGVPFASIAAKGLNNKIFEHIRAEAEKATLFLGKKIGACKIGDGKRRNSTLLAVAPTTSNSTIQGGISQGIEPIASNYFIQKSAKGDFVRKNKELEKLLVELDHNTDDIWQSIKDNDGSVAHLSFLTSDQKELFKTFKEINQYAILDQAADRQKYIDQGQSLNIFIPLDADPKDISKLHIYAHKRGIKGLYYQRGETIMNTKSLSSNTLDENCLFCEA